MNVCFCFAPVLSPHSLWPIHCGHGRILKERSPAPCSETRRGCDESDSFGNGVMSGSLVRPSPTTELLMKRICPKRGRALDRSGFVITAGPVHIQRLLPERICTFPLSSPSTRSFTPDRNHRPTQNRTTEHTLGFFLPLSLRCGFKNPLYGLKINTEQIRIILWSVNFLLSDTSLINNQVK